MTLTPVDDDHLAARRSRIREDEIKAQLDRILASPDFLSTSRNSQFLRYVVEEALRGRGGRMKAYTIALAVFGRDETFDADNDPLVRKAAGQLRRSLERYYLSSGAGDEILITIPKGRYVPVFQRRRNMPERPAPTVFAASGWPRRIAMAAVPLLVVLLAAIAMSGRFRLPAGEDAVPPESFAAKVVVVPFVSLGEGRMPDGLAKVLTEELVVALSRFRHVTVVAADTGPGDIGAGADFVLTGSVRASGGQSRTTVHLTDRHSGRQIWANAYDRAAGGTSPPSSPDPVVASIVATVADPYSRLLVRPVRAAEALPAIPKSRQAYECVLSIYSYWMDPTRERHAELRECHEEATRFDAGYSDAWVNLGWLYMDEFRFGYNPRPGADPLRDAGEAARRGLAASPDNARAHALLSSVAWYRQDVESFRREAERALRLNPYDTALIGDYSFRLALLGEWDNALPLIARAGGLDPLFPPYPRLALALRWYLDGEYGRALEEVEQTGMRDLLYTHILRAMALAMMERPEEAADAYRTISGLDPALAADPAGRLREYGMSADLAAQVMAGLAKAREASLETTARDAAESR